MNFSKHVGSHIIKIQYLDDSIQRLTYIGGKSDWIDLAAAPTAAGLAAREAVTIQSCLDQSVLNLFART